MAEAKRFDGRIGAAIRWISRFLAGFGLVDAQRGEEAATLAFPRVLTGFARQSQRTADLLMVGIAVGPVGIAGLALAAPFWSVAGGISGGISNAAIGLISQRFGANKYEQMDIAIKQTIWVSTLVALPVTTLYAGFASDLIAIIGGQTSAIEYGVIYLQTIAFAIPLAYLNKIAIRTLVGTGDSLVELEIRGSAAVLNIILNAIFIFGFGLGVFGAAIGTVFARLFVLISFSIGFYRGKLPIIGEFPAQLSAYPYFDAGLIKQLLKLSWPLVLRRSAKRVAKFPLIAIVATFGTSVVAAYGIARRASATMRTPNWGFSLAASSLVGQELGANNEAMAEEYGWDVARFALVIYLIIALLALVFARQIAFVFTRDITVIETAVPFIRILGVAAILYGVDGVSTGILRAGGDTTWPMYARFIGLYLFTLPIAYLAVSTSLGLMALYLALLTESLIPSSITTYRVSTGKWKVISREYRPSPGG